MAALLRQSGRKLLVLPARTSAVTAGGGKQEPEKPGWLKLWIGEEGQFKHTVEFEKMPKDFKEHPDRDTKNFPHPEVPMFPAKTRFGFIPDSWFQFFYPKTGVTGPYMFLFGTSAFLLSKEYVVMAEHFNQGVGLAAICFLAHRFVGPTIRELFVEQRDALRKDKHDWAEAQTRDLHEGIAAEKDMQVRVQGVNEMMLTAKRENVALQLEAAYRERVQSLHAQVKRKLDYLADMEEAKRRFKQKHMADWIVAQVNKSITPQLEQAIMKQCIVDLKSMKQ